MKNTIIIEARRFPVTIRVSKVGTVDVHEDITLSKEQLQAAQLVGQSSKELIQRMFGRKGYTVQDIGKSEKRTLVLDLDALWDGAYNG